MTGPEHYRAAESHLSAACYLDGPNGKPVDPTASAFHLAAAQAHATLAQVAVFAMSQRIADSGDSTGHPSHEHYEDWLDVIEHDDEAVA